MILRLLLAALLWVVVVLTFTATNLRVAGFSPPPTFHNNNNNQSRPNDPSLSKMTMTSHQQQQLAAAAGGQPYISISDAFDGGNIQFVGQSLTSENNEITVELAIQKDPFSELEQTHHYQYFAFRATAVGPAEGVRVKFVIVNAGEVSYPAAWEGSTVCFSPTLQLDDNVSSWQRKVETRYDASQKLLSWTHTYNREGESQYFSYFVPFSYQNHLQLVSKCAAAAANRGAVLTSLGQSLEGRDIDLITMGTGNRTAWIIHRQHPGESQASFYAEGLLGRLLGFENDKANLDDNVQKLLERYTLYIVPCMCPDGVFKGHLRTNACGANLNREWATTQEDYPAPTLERSPEVYHVLRRMEESPPDLFLDIHGDEELPVNFLAGAQGTPHWGPRMEHLHGAFLAAYVRANSDMQQAVGYTPVDPDKVVVNTATKVVATRFDCLSFTLEMPFKDCATNPDPQHGWSPNRARQLGASVVDPLLYIHPHLRAEGDFWKDFPAEDAYVRPQHRPFTYGPQNEVLDL